MLDTEATSEGALVEMPLLERVIVYPSVDGSADEAVPRLTLSNTVEADAILNDDEAPLLWVTFVLPLVRV